MDEQAPSGDDVRMDLRKITSLLAEDPAAWESVRGPTRQFFDDIAADWESRVGPHHIALLQAALEEVPEPRVALDLGTGTGVGADAITRRFPNANVAGADIAEQMVRVAVVKQRAHPVLFLVADGARLPFGDASLDLVVALNVFVFFLEIARVLAPEGRLVILYSLAEETPIYLPSPELHQYLRTAGLGRIVEGRAAKGIFHIAAR